MKSLAVSGAKTIIQESLGLTSGADLVLLIDETALPVVEPISEAARQLGINLTTLFYSRDQQLQIDNLPRIDRNTLDSAEAAILAHTADDAYSMFRTKLVSQWRGHTRLATMPGASRAALEIVARSDHLKMRQRCEALTPALLNGRECVVTTHGPDSTTCVLQFTLGQLDRIPVHSLGIIRENAWGNIPSGEIFTAPLETSANGEYLVNGTIGRKILDEEPAILSFEGGRLVRHRYASSGGPIPYLLELEQVSRSRNDHQWNVIAEFGIGVNEGIAKLTGVPLLDEKIFGTVHIALGMNIGWQGINHSLVHCDIVTRDADVQIDGRTLLTRGRHDFDPGIFDDLAIYRPPRGFNWPKDAISARVNPLNFTLRQHGEFWVRLRGVQSGRLTEFPIANRRTAAAARRLTKRATRQVVHLAEISGDAALPSGEELRRLLTMLWSYGVLEPLSPDTRNDR